MCAYCYHKESFLLRVCLVGGHIGDVQNDGCGSPLDLVGSINPLIYVDLINLHQTEVSMAALGVAVVNGSVERVIHTIAKEKVYLSKYINFADVALQIRAFIETISMINRVHLSLGYLTPVEFEDAHGFELKSVLAGSP
jgi:hypothetical protein